MNNGYCFYDEELNVIKDYDDEHIWKDENFVQDLRVGEYINLRLNDYQIITIRHTTSNCCYVYLKKINDIRSVVKEKIKETKQKDSTIESIKSMLYKIYAELSNPKSKKVRVRGRGIDRNSVISYDYLNLG